MVVCPAIISSGHGMGDVDFPFVLRLNEDIVQDVQVLGSLVLSCCFVLVQDSEQGHNQAVFCTEIEKQMSICFVVANTENIFHV